MKRLSPETIADIKALRRIGHPYTEIVRKTGASKTSVARLAKGLHPRRKSGSRKKHPPQAYIRLREEGLSFAQIAARLGVAKSAVHRHLRSVG
ncbi:MAG TPA: helix-turn-helix domain-containing protein [Microvirga sp.]|jgi:DNA-binding IclR family transcriptional regulator|nr:helix-turn-helix domain-containing protein [Microvirga sp.]